ncbi:MAG: hypothetical protein J6Y07_01200 [Alphaproteobacteria bacterium]|nr:hypothetical protein [Alphaproteobacteria bacterium]
MWEKIRDFVLRALPYVASIVGGVLLFTISLDNIHDPNVADLITNISASLLAIPLVFLLYDYTNSRVSQRLQETMTTNVDDKINTLVLHMVLVLRKMLGVRGRTTLMNINKMQTLSETHIIKKLRMDGKCMNLLHGYYNELENIIYRYGRENVLSTDDLRVLTELGRHISHMVNEHHLRGNRRIIARHVKNTIEKVVDWLDSGAAIAMKFEKLLAEAELAGSDDETQKDAPEK